MSTQQLIETALTQIGFFLSVAKLVELYVLMNRRVEKLERLVKKCNVLLTVVEEDTNNKIVPHNKTYDF
jgi:hypothetical protein